MVLPEFGIFLFLSVGAASLFGFLAVAAYAGSRQQERESYYKNDMLKKLSEAQSSGAAAAIEYLRFEHDTKEAHRQQKKREGYILGGLCNLGVGIALTIFLWAISHHQPVFYVGLFPIAIGIALLVYVYLLGPQK